MGSAFRPAFYNFYVSHQHNKIFNHQKQKIYLLYDNDILIFVNTVNEHKNLQLIPNPLTPQ